MFPSLTNTATSFFGASIATSGPDKDAFNASKVSVVLPMASASDRGQVCTTSSAYTTTPAYAIWYWRASGWTYGWVSWSTGIGSGQWNQIVLPKPVIIKSYSITPWSSDTWNSRCITLWKLQASLDGITWIDLDFQSKDVNSWVRYKEVYFSCATNSTPYQIYRILILGNGGDSYVGIDHLGLYEN